MENKELYMKLLLYASCLLMLIGGVRMLVIILNRIMLSLGMSALLFVVGAMFFVAYKNLSHKE